jgi:hypothetical protein
MLRKGEPATPGPDTRSGRFLHFIFIDRYVAFN